MFFATRRSRTVGNNFRIRPARPAKLLQRPALQQTRDHCTARRRFLVAAPNVRGLARGCRKEFAPPPRAPVSREDCPLTEVQLLELHRQRNPQVARRNSRLCGLNVSPFSARSITEGFAERPRRFAQSFDRFECEDSRQMRRQARVLTTLPVAASLSASDKLGTSGRGFAPCEKGKRWGFGISALKVRKASRRRLAERARMTAENGRKSRLTPVGRL